jgi:DNA invertase Pin-like site-specific DNA recombinase
MPKAYSYIRFSSEGQARGDSLRRQIQKAEDFVRKTSSTLGLELDTTLSLSDPAMSAYRGTNLKRGALAAFIAAVENGSVEDGSFLLVESFDRLSRQQSDKSLRLLLDLVDAGVTVVTLNDEKIYNKETLSGTDGTFAIMSSLISMSRAHEESALKGSRVRAAWANKIANISKGKQLTKKVPFWLTTDRKLKPEKVALVQEIYKLHSAGHGATVIAKLLNSRNEPTPTGKGHWQQSTIRKLVTGKQGYGKYFFHLQPFTCMIVTKWSCRDLAAVSASPEFT